MQPSAVVIDDKPSRQWLILAGLALGVTITNGFARFAYGLLLPSMKSEMGWSYAQAGWLNTANAVGYIIGAVLTMVLIRTIPPTRLFVVGLLATTATLLATGMNDSFWWQTLWRTLSGIFGALSFSTAGVLAASLFQDAPKKNALAIALLFGTGGGLGIVFSAIIIPPFLDIYGTGAWPFGWVIIGAISVLFLPLGLWAAFQLGAPSKSSAQSVRLPLRRMMPELIGYGAFGLGYIVYLTFLSAWMTERSSSAAFVTSVWVILGVCLSVSPFVWRPVFARYASGTPLALILLCVAVGSALPVVISGPIALVISALVFGLSVFMAPGAITNFSRQNLPPESWGRAVALFTVVFAIAQTISPYGAGLIGDLFNDIGPSLIVAAAILLIGAIVAFFQRPLSNAYLNG